MSHEPDQQLLNARGIALKIRSTHLGEARLGDDGSNGVRDAAAEQELLEHRLIRRAVIDAERGAVLRLRERGAVTDETWRRVERDLDLEELRMEA